MSDKDGNRGRARRTPRALELIGVVVLACAFSAGGALMLLGDAPEATAVSKSKKKKSKKVKRNLDVTDLKVGDGKTTTSGPKRGYVYTCQDLAGQSPVSGPWISGTHWDATEKPTVDGEVDWPNARVDVKRVGGDRTVSGNGLPDHATGKFPIESGDEAFQYDRNPNSIGEHEYSITLPAEPDKADETTCANMGPVGVLNNGVALFNAVDAGGADAGAHEIQDECEGHPDRSTTYHYHALSDCIKTGSKKHASKQIGWALDGFPITGPRGKHGKYLRNSDLDACHGTTSKVKIDGEKVRTYHYVATQEYPYTVGCYRGTPVLQAG